MGDLACNYLSKQGKMNGPGGATNATPGPDHGNLYERSNTMADAANIAESRALSTRKISGAAA